jgi:hypothetical protein
MPSFGHCRFKTKVLVALVGDSLRGSRIGYADCGLAMQFVEQEFFDVEQFFTATMSCFNRSSRYRCITVAVLGR